MAATTESIFNNFTMAHPEDSIVVYKFTAPGGACSYYGTELLNINLGGDEWLKAYKLSKSLGPPMNSDEVKSKAFPFIYDTRSITDNGTRRTILKNSLANIFPNHHVNVFIFEEDWSRRNRSRGAAAFKNEYGSDVDIVLS